MYACACEILKIWKYTPFDKSMNCVFIRNMSTTTSMEFVGSSLDVIGTSSACPSKNTNTVDLGWISMFSSDGNGMKMREIGNFVISKGWLSKALWLFIVILVTVNLIVYFAYWYEQKIS